VKLDGARVKGNPVKVGSGLRHCKQIYQLIIRFQFTELVLGRIEINNMICKPGNLP
jgi:hypothetical protein